jgi:uncharacterized membrane protein YsdA (DUF1294 family)
MRDQIIGCVECGRQFVWTYGEQRYYRERGLSSPKRCKNCRARRRERTQPSWWANVALRDALLVSVITIAVAMLVWWAGRPLPAALSWLVAVNLVTFFAYAYDKSASRSQLERLPESVLLALAAAGGTLSALAAMLLFRHKTAKGGFQFKLLCIAVVQSLTGVAYLLIAV